MNLDAFAANLLRELTLLIEAYEPPRHKGQVSDYLEGVIDARIDILQKLGVDSIPTPPHWEILNDKRRNASAKKPDSSPQEKIG